MKKIKLLTMIVCAAMLVIMTGCARGRDKVENDNDYETEEKETTDKNKVNTETTPQVTVNVQDETTSSKQEETTAPKEEETTTAKEEETTAVPEGKGSQYVEKIGEFSGSCYYISAAGLGYKADGKYGIYSIDGQMDTGNQYVRIEALGEYYSVQLNKPNDSNDFASLNSVGLLDRNGNMVVPAKYAVIKAVGGERFYILYEATEQTTVKEEALVYLTKDYFSFSPSEDDVLYKCVWTVYDSLTGKIVEGVTGTTRPDVRDYSGLLMYKVDEEMITINENGEKLPSTAKVYDNGCYMLTEDNTIYDSKGNKLFVDGANGYKILGSSGDYFYGWKSENYNDKYVVIDKGGNVISAEFSKSPTVINNSHARVNGELYRFSGEKFIEGNCYNAYYRDGYWLIILEDKNIRLLTEDGTEVFSVMKEGNIFAYNSDFLIGDIIDGKTKYVSLVEKDFVIEGMSLAPWLVMTNKVDGKRTVVDVRNGETILSDYTYYYSDTAADGTCYIVAQKAGGYDIYTLVK
ncbi:MAG: hypothetical protein IJW18_08630 [Lachnospiraceae bacterium]|nr:hypothetical protein [Lachnospiraceae bacterium]